MRAATRFRISSKLKKAVERDARSLTQLCAPFGLHQSSLSSILHGKIFTAPTRDRLVALGAALGVPPEGCVRRVKAVSQ